jgi:hypothetical protein
MCSHGTVTGTTALLRCGTAGVLALLGLCAGTASAAACRYSASLLSHPQAVWQFPGAACMDRYLMPCLFRCAL